MNGKMWKFYVKKCWKSHKNSNSEYNRNCFRCNDYYVLIVHPVQTFLRGKYSEELCEKWCDEIQRNYWIMNFLNIAFLNDDFYHLTIIQRNLNSNDIFSPKETQFWCREILGNVVKFGVAWGFGNMLSHWGLVTPYGVGDLGQHWFR